ncbi:MAG: transposase [Rhabdochlamydiaceae bacterium]
MKKKNNRLNRTQKREIYRDVRQNIERLLTYSIDRKRARYSKKDHARLLIYASLLNAFAEGISQSLDQAPSADTLLHYIKSQDRDKVQEAFESQLKRSILALKRQRKLWKAVSIAIDWHDQMYYGDHKNTPMVNGTKPKEGSSYAFQFLTVSLLVEGERLVVGVTPLDSRNELPTLTLIAIEKLRELGVKISDVTIDAGFFSAEMIDLLRGEFERNSLGYLIRMPINRKAKKMKLWEGRRFTYVLEDRSRISSGPYPKVSFQVVVSYDRDKQRKDGKDYVYLFATNFHHDSQKILDLYKDRWAIETGYRMYNQFLMKTTSGNYIIRLFYFLFACLMYNAWVIYNNEEGMGDVLTIKVIQLKTFLIEVIIKMLEMT